MYADLVDVGDDTSDKIGEPGKTEVLRKVDDHHHHVMMTMLMYDDVVDDDDV